MNPLLGQLPDVPPVKELWKREKSQYRVWIILFGVSILTILSLLITSIVLTQIGGGKKEIIDKWYQYYLNEFRDHAAKDNANASFNWNQTIMPSIMVAMVGIGAMLFLTTTIKAYQKQNFAFISNWSTFSVGLGAMVGFVQLMRQIQAPHLVTPVNTVGGIVMLIAYILFIVIWIMASMPLVKIRREFQLSMRIEAIKNDPRYQATMANPAAGAGMQQGPYGMGPIMGAQMATPTQPGTENQTPQPNMNNVKTKEDKRREALENMTVAELKKVASKLSISGHKDMRKAELIDAIMRISKISKEKK